MIQAIFLLVILTVLALLLVGRLASKSPLLNGRLMRWLIGYHVFFWLVYYLYATFNPSDSRYYYIKVITDYRGPAWGDFYGTSTTFIEWLAYPFIRFFGFTYESMMVLFSFIGLIGFIYLYIFFKENVKFRHTILRYDLVTVIMFLPNLHFWSNSLGKGSVIFAGIGLFFYGISNLRNRWIHILIGGLIIYHVRPHILLIVLVSSAVGFMFSTKGVSVVLRAVFLVGASIAFFFIYKDVLTLVGIDEGEFVSEGLNLSHRASELSKATSGIDISNYSLPEQVFAFLYRPLFFDAPGLLGIIVSFENVFYLFITIRLFSLNGLKFLFTGGFLVKAAFLSFITVTVALAQVSGNLGLAMRQKSQVMVLFMFVVIAFLDSQKMRLYQERLKRQRRLAKFNEGLIADRASEGAQQ